MTELEADITEAFRCETRLAQPRARFAQVAYEGESRGWWRTLVLFRSDGGAFTSTCDIAIRCENGTAVIVFRAGRIVMDWKVALADAKAFTKLSKRVTDFVLTHLLSWTTIHPG